MTKSVSAEDIRQQPLAAALSERYLAYALSTIVSRSLPDVRDGLKPVHRRLLYAMRQLRLDPKRGFKKCARVVGDVMGKYHPHGDSAIYDAMVRLAQDFAARYPLVEGQGNFGNIDGDGAAAMRYTEARLTDVAIALMEGLDDDAVDFRDTYDGEDSEPVVMPAAFPNLLANGAAGIAVGMATSIPPHNVGEICDALLRLINAPASELLELLKFIKGPDFPTGGVVLESPHALHAAYATGRGGFRLRARWEVEKLTHGLYQIVVTEIPYQVQKAKVIEKIADLLNARKLPLLADVRDESAEEVRVVLEPRNRGVDPALLMEHVFRRTDLEVRFALNMNVLDADGTPRVMSLKEVLQAFLSHRHQVLIRRGEHRLGKIDHRLAVLDGYLVAFLNLDETIRIIREEDEPKSELMKTFALIETQAEAILNMRLRSLRRLEEMEIRREHDTLSAEKMEIETLLADDGLRWRAIAAQIREIRARFGGDAAAGGRRTAVADAPRVAAPLEAVIEREPITILLSEKGWIRAVKGHGDAAPDARFKDGDRLALRLKAQTTDKVLFFGDNGRFYAITGDRIPRGRGFGEPLRLIVDLPNDAAVVAMFAHVEGRERLVVSAGGRGFRVAENDLVGQTRIGRKVLTLAEGDSARFAVPLPKGADTVAVIGETRKMLLFPLAEVPIMAKGRGVIFQKYKTGGGADIKAFRAADGLTFKRGAQTRSESDLAPWLGGRGGVGKPPPTGFPRSNSFGDGA